MSYQSYHTSWAAISFSSSSSQPKCLNLQELALSPHLLLSILLDWTHPSIPTASVPFLTMWCPCLYHQPTPVLWSPNPNVATYSTSLLEGWAPYGCSVPSLSHSPSSSSSSICRVGHHCTFWIEYKPHSLMGKIKTVWLLGVRASMWCQSIKLSWTLALLGCADLCSLWAAPCPWSLGLRVLVVLSHFKDWHSFHFLPWPQHHWPYCFHLCVLWIALLVPMFCPVGHHRPRSYQHAFTTVLTPESQGYIWCPLFPLLS